jgi:hypothetical protein
VILAEIQFFAGGGAKPPKFPTKLSNFRQTPPFALEKAVFSPLLGQNFRKFVISGEGGGASPHQDFRHWSRRWESSCYLNVNFRKSLDLVGCNLPHRSKIFIKFIG